MGRNHPRPARPPTQSPAKRVEYQSLFIKLYAAEVRRLAVYITAWRKLLPLTKGLIVPPNSEIRAACSILSNSPVAGYPRFIPTEVRLLGIYRETLNPRSLSGRMDDVWIDIVQNEWYAWLYAVHEAGELQAFAEIDVNPFDLSMWKSHWKVPHLRATVGELRFLRGWSRRLGIDVPELAIESEHLLRKGYASHVQFIRDLQADQYWSASTSSELEAARQFWQQIKRGNL